MKTLYLLRHAKSDWGDSSLKDFDRPLNDRGWKAAKAIGQEMRGRDMVPDLVFVSPAARTKETIYTAFGSALHDVTLDDIAGWFQDRAAYAMQL